METETRQALLFPQSEGSPQLVEVLVTVTRVGGQRVMTPHPQLLMHMLSDGPATVVCKTLVIDSLKGMSRKFATPFVVFSPNQSHCKATLPMNKTIANIISNFGGIDVWRGDVVVIKYDSTPFGEILDCMGSDFPLIKNWLISFAREARR